MPGYPWLAKTTARSDDIETKMRALRSVGVPYADADIAGAGKQLAGKTEQDVLIAYLQVLGTALKSGTAPKNVRQ